MRNENLIDDINANRGLHPVKVAKAAMVFSTSHVLKFRALKFRALTLMNRRIRTRTFGGVGGAAAASLSRS